MLPCMRPQEPVFEHETAINLEHENGVTSARYDCRIEFKVAADDAVYVQQVDVWFGSLKHGCWQDCRNVMEPEVAEALHEAANDMADVLFDTVAVAVEDRRREAAVHDYELRIDNADARGHAHRERMAERRMW